MLALHNHARAASWSKGCRFLGTLQCCSRNSKATAIIIRRPPPSSHNHAFRRAIKTQAVANLVIDIPNDRLQNEMHPDPVGPTYPTAVQQARTNMLKFENCVLLTRIGGFYEMLFEHAEEFGPLLNLKVAKKSTSGGPVSMAGFPFLQLDRYLKVLVQDLNQYVAIAEEFPNDAVAKVKSGGLMFDRRVARVVTPGTLIDESFMDGFTNNYLLSVSVEDTPGLHTRPTSNGAVAEDPRLADTPVGLAWLDLSTGQFNTQISTGSMLSALISRIGPREIILDDSLRDMTANHTLFSILMEDRYLVNYLHTDACVTKNWTSTIEDVKSRGKGANFSVGEIKAASLLLHYVDTRLQGVSKKIQDPTRVIAGETMVIDKNTMRALEIKSTMKEGHLAGSLLHAIRRTVTKGGARLLDEWLGAPSTSINVINSRLDMVDYFLKNRDTAEKLVTLLKRSHDSKRLVQKFALGRGDADDLIGLANTIAATSQVKLILLEPGESPCFTNILPRMELEGPDTLLGRIRSCIDEEGVVQQHRIEENNAGVINDLAEQMIIAEGTAADVAAIAKKGPRKKPTSLREHYSGDGDTWIMLPDASPTLHELHEELQEFDRKKVLLTNDLQQRLGVLALTLHWTPKLGHVCHIRPKSKEKPRTTELRSVSTSKTTQSVEHPEWTALGREMDQVRLRIRAEEQRIFSALREEVVLNLLKLRQNASVLDEIDIACSFASLATEQNLVRPTLNNGTAHRIVGGRHPTVQGGLTKQGRSFVKNDCFVGDKEQVWLITGPNMAGKSTFLRQNALITIMAQIGCYVPAQYAEIGIVDQIFSRVGSADNLFRDQSTFMVEMIETATILKHATPRSFVIMDEIGRGTTPKAGTAVAFACLHHLHNINNCRTLFATHFHALADMSKGMRRIGYYCTDVMEDDDGGFGYVHKLRRGVNSESHALKVARIAGVPEVAIKVAEAVLLGKDV